MDTLETNRRGIIRRKTKETDVALELNLDGQGRYEIDTGVGFLDHMLTHLSKHGRIDLTLKAKGDACGTGHCSPEPAPDQNTWQAPA